MYGIIRGVCCTSILPLRAKPDHRQEMVSMLLFGEVFSILEETGSWFKIKMEWDGYEGWISGKAIIRLSENEYQEMTGEKVRVINNLLRILPVENKRFPVFVLPGSTVLPDRQNMIRLGNSQYICLTPLPVKVSSDPVQMIRNAMGQFIHAPYLWGGRSLFGIDCSGLTQVLFKIAGIRLPRDAQQQAAMGKDIPALENALPGDLAFFGDGDEKMTHTGIILDDNHIIHASGTVRIDSIDTHGIKPDDGNTYSHLLRCIRRILS